MSGSSPGREVLVTGCSSGIGRTVAQGLRDRGYRVFATARKAQDVESLAGCGFEALQLDVSDSGSLQRAVGEVLEKTGGRLYALFNNASKYALEGLSDTLGLELRDTGIHVVIIEPGPVESRFRENAYAAFKRNIDAENSVHRAVYFAMERRLTAEGSVAPFTLPPEAVLKKVVHALESR